MSCDAVSALYLMVAASSPLPADAGYFVRVADAAVPSAPASVAREPMFAEIIAKAGALNTRVSGMRDAIKANPATALPGYAAFKADIGALAAANEAGSTELRKRGGDSDLKCILHGIAQDLPKRLTDLEAAATAIDKDKALREMSYLLRDNVELIAAPPAPPV